MISSLFIYGIKLHLIFLTNIQISLVSCNFSKGKGNVVLLLSRIFFGACELWILLVLAACMSRV